MALTSTHANTSQEDSMRIVYSTSAPNDTMSDWIQPSISTQIFDYSKSTLIEGIYVKSVPGEQVLPVAQEEDWDIDNELDAMAADPEIQRELGQIQSEFQITEADGLNDDL